MHPFKAYLALTIFLFTSFLLEAKPPYPKIQKLYDRGKYDICLEKISAAQGNARGENLLWLYYMQMSCQQALFFTQRDHGHLKKALQAGRRLKQKNKGSFPDYARDTARRLRDVVLYQAGRSDKLSPKASKTMDECVNMLPEVFDDHAVKWFFFQRWRTVDPDKAEEKLSEAVTANYRDRKQGDTADFLYGFIALMKLSAERGAMARGMDIFLKATEVYPGSGDELCAATTSSIEAVLNEHSIGRYDINRGAHRWIDTLPAGGCSNAALQVHVWKEEFEYACEMTGSAADAANAARNLIRHAPDSIGTTWFRKQFMSRFGTFNRADSVRMAVWLELAGIREVKATLNALLECGLELTRTERMPEAYAIYRFMLRRFPKPLDQKPAQQLRQAINTRLINVSDATGKPLTLQNILDFYELNKTMSGAREETLSRLLKLHDNMLLKSNFSQCMRITCEGLRLFPGEIRLLRAKYQWMQADYQANYASLRSGFEAEVTGAQPEACREGVVTAEYQKRFMTVFNCVRRMAGLYDSCVLNAEANARCQKAALIMTANGELTHSPAKNAKCYSEDGARGAGSSNLSLGHNGINALFGQLNDAGSGNYFVGHRRWILNPYNAVFGHGSCDNAMSLGVFGMNQDQPAGLRSYQKEDFVAWPTADFFPSDWLTSRWSFGLSGADFSQCKVRMTRAGKPVPLKQNVFVSGYGQNTVVWEPDIGPREIRDVTVYIDQVRWYNSATDKYEIRNFSYRVKVF